MLLSNTQEIANVANGSLSVDRKIYFEGVSTDTRSDVEGSFLLLLKEPILMDMTLLKLLKIMVQKLLFPIRISTQTYH